MQIALNSSQLTWGGGEQLLWSLGETLIERGFSPLWVAPSASVLMDRVKAKGWDRFAVRRRHPSLSELSKLRNLVVRNRIQILHGNDSHAITWGALVAIGLSRRVHRVGVKHTIFKIRTTSKYNWMVDQLVCVSRAVREVCLDAGVLSKKISVIHGGVKSMSLCRSSERTLAASSLGISRDVPLLCAVGSLIPCKGFELLIESAKHLKAQGVKFMLVICGEGSSRFSLQKQIDDSDLQDSIRLIGFCEHPEKWIAASDVFVHPSHSEGLSLVSIMAQQLGTPVVASDIGGLQEVLRSPATSRPLGWGFASKCPEDLARLIVDAMQFTDVRDQIVQEAREIATHRFSVERMADSYLDIYSKLIGNEKCSRGFYGEPLRLEQAG